MALRPARRSSSRAPKRHEEIDPLTLHAIQADRTSKIPDVIEFVTSDKYLDRPNIYPRQATLLKLIFLQEEIFTQYDYDVIGQWSDAFLRTEDSSGYGNNGTQPDILERMKISRDIGRRWFREFLFVGGRRGGKGHIGALSGSYVLWHYLQKGDPQGYYGVDRDKQLGSFVFAAKKEQAKAFQWRDLKNVITGGPCFTGSDGANYISKNQEEKLTLYAPHDFQRMHQFDKRGVSVESDMATFTIEPKESTLVSARGPALFMEHFDEMAWVERGTAKSSAGEVYDQAKPALDQFGLDGFMPQLSSPWQKSGKFYENYTRALEKNDDGTPAYADMLMVQLASWDIYEDWERSTEIPVRPIPESEEIKRHRTVEVEENKRDLDTMFDAASAEDVEAYRKSVESARKSRAFFFPKIKRAIQDYDAQMESEERANPETFKVERRAHFATVQDAYLNPERVAEIWLPWPDPNGPPLVQKDRGILATAYRAHGDPSKSGANFGFAIAHREGPDEQGMYHVVFDRIHAWLPVDYENHEVDYNDIEEDIGGWIKGFMPVAVTFDQYNSVGSIQRLRQFVKNSRLPKHVDLYERSATGPLNWKTFETFKTAIGMNLVHGPLHELANLELTFLQETGGRVDHPTIGPVQTKDVADCLAILVYELIGEQMSAFMGKSLGDMAPRGAQQGGIDAYKDQRQDDPHRALANFGRSRGRGTPGYGRR